METAMRTAGSERVGGPDRGEGLAIWSAVFGATGVGAGGVALAAAAGARMLGLCEGLEGAVFRLALLTAVCHALAVLGAIGMVLGLASLWSRGRVCGWAGVGLNAAVLAAALLWLMRLGA